MIALDTNILARLLLRDDEEQYSKAVGLLGDGREYTAPATVILELAWVLGSYGIKRNEIAAGLKGLLGLTNFKPANRAEIIFALTMYEAGLDFADALHLALSAQSDGFATLDGQLAKRAGRLGIAPEVQRI